jgi:hypothetical protein
MSKIVLTEDLAKDRWYERRLDKVESMKLASEGRCQNCRCILVENRNQGILICAHTHEDQYQEYMEEQKFECQGIGKNAVCGVEATVKVPSTKWNSETEKIEQVYVHICPKHAEELATKMSNLWKTSRKAAPA